MSTAHQARGLRAPTEHIITDGRDGEGARGVADDKQVISVESHLPIASEVGERPDERCQRHLARPAIEEEQRIFIDALARLEGGQGDRVAKLFKDSDVAPLTRIERGQQSEVGGGVMNRHQRAPLISPRRRSMR